MFFLKDRVAQVFYTHGLFCASHPFSILVSVCLVILAMCYPLVYIPLPGNVPVEYVTPLAGYRSSPDGVSEAPPIDGNTDVTSIPRWYKGPAIGYVQQIVVKTAVSPWDPASHDPIDALRVPLGKVFEILDYIYKFRHKHGKHGLSIENCCLRVSEPLRSKRSEHILPEYGCLVLSPANLWRKDHKKYFEDPEILRTLHRRYIPALEAAPGIRDILFGVPWSKTGISRYFIRNKQRTISFAITLVLKAYDRSFIHNLRHKLEAIYPETTKYVNNSEIEHVVNLHYKDINIVFEYIHLLVIYVVLLLYLYFSVKKIEMVKSKWGLALSAVVTVVSSLCISVSVCSVVGLNTRLNGGEIFPYLVVLIGIENVLVVTKSVVSTSIDMDVRYRVATGLSKEGWSIAKTLVTELSIIALGFLTFVPEIQEFSFFALVGLLTDFFLQMIFFVTVLSLDIRRMELSDLHKHRSKPLDPYCRSSDIEHSFQPLISCPFRSATAVDRAKFTPRINLNTGTSMITKTGEQTSPKVQHEKVLFQRETLLEIPRRLRLINFWAGTRVVQRFIMVCSVVWIMLIVYKSGLLQHLTQSSAVADHHNVTADAMEQIFSDTKPGQNVAPLAFMWRRGDVEPPGSVEQRDLETWRKLAITHWTMMFGFYNISIHGKYISILPSIHLSLIVPPDEAIQQRFTNANSKLPANDANINIPHVATEEQISRDIHSEIKEEMTKDKPPDKQIESDKYSDPEKEPEIFSKEYMRKYYPYVDPEHLEQFYPKSQKELVITVSLVFLSIICVTYFMTVVYRCMCSRKYSKWRASWCKPRDRSRANNYVKQLKETLPIVLRGHSQEIECLVNEGSVIVSSCLGGQLRVWDSITGECLHVMQRKTASPPMKRKPCEGRNIEDSDADLYAEYHGNGSMDTDDLDVDLYCAENTTHLRHRNSQPHQQKRSNFTGRFDNMPDLSHTIDTKFNYLYQTQKQGESMLKSDTSKEVKTANTTISTSRDISDISEDSLPTVKHNTSGYDFIEKFGKYYSDLGNQGQGREGYDTSGHGYSEESSSSAESNKSRSLSEGDFSTSMTASQRSLSDPCTDGPPSPIWCLACKGSLIVAGCGNGRIEFWDATTGALKCLYAQSTAGVTAVNFVCRRVIAARLDGSIDFLELETFQDPKALTPLSPNSLNKKIKGHSRHLSHSRCGSDDIRLSIQVIHCTHILTVHAHQRPITVLQTEGGRIVSGSQDFTLKVFRLEDYKCLYTLHGHMGSVTALSLDKCPPYAAVSGSADGTIRLWDLLTGHCAHKVKGHDGVVVSLTCTEQHIISSGLDDKLCVWERKRGHLLYSVEMETSCGSSMAMLCNNFLVTGGQGCLYLWDVHKGELVRVVSLEDRERVAFIHHIQSMDTSAIVCDFGSEIKVINFPVVLEKVE